MSAVATPVESNRRAGAEVVAPLHGEHHRGHRSREETAEGSSPFVPLLVFFAAAVAWSGFQFLQLELEGESLQALRGNQEAQVQQAQRVRATLDAMAVETQKLADLGNANARLIVDELRKRGITISRPAEGAK
jgi:hypothetical protein